MTIHIDYVLERLNRYNTATTQSERDDLLYRIGTHTGALSLQDQQVIDNLGGMSPEHRCKVLNWIGYQAEADIRDDLPLLVQVFSVEVLTAMQATAKLAYPDFELVMGLRPGRECLELSMHFQPSATAPMLNLSTDFLWKPFWDAAELFWNNLPGDTTDFFNFTLSVYPTQASVTRSGVSIESWMAVPDEDDDLYQIRGLLECLTTCCLS